MHADDMVLVSVDDHVVEPPEVFEGRLEEKYQDEAPKFITRADGTMAWLHEGQELVNVALNAVAGRPRDEYGWEPTSIDEIRPGCYDVHARVKDMDAGGTLGSLNFPSFPGYVGKVFLPTAERDRDLAAALVRAYNDWHLEAWAGAYPDRFIPLILPMMWDAELTAAEVRRAAGEGLPRGDVLVEPVHARVTQHLLRHWDPFWEACVEVGTVPACTSVRPARRGHVARRADRVHLSLSPVNLIEAATDVVWSPMFRKYPALRVALSEGGIGWIPYFRERIDYTSTTRALDRHGPRRQAPVGDLRRAGDPLLHRRPDRRREASPDQHRQCLLGDATTPTPTSSGRSRPNGDGSSFAGVLRRRHRQDHAPERDAALQVRSLRPPARENCTVGALRRSAERLGREHHDRRRAARARRGPLARRAGDMAGVLEGVRVVEVSMSAMVPATGAI